MNVLFVNHENKPHEDKSNDDSQEHTTNHAHAIAPAIKRHEYYIEFCKVKAHAHSYMCFEQCEIGKSNKLDINLLAPPIMATTFSSKPLVLNAIPAAVAK
eukprot:CCRYP_007512-RB/>CCRYP_007512-RB protein AED:0.46 eAED:1.00 QI:0/0/0/1/0/0/2/0/99